MVNVLKAVSHLSSRLNIPKYATYNNYINMDFKRINSVPWVG
jgi:hypothetical protein